MSFFNIHYHHKYIVLYHTFLQYSPVGHATHDTGVGEGSDIATLIPSTDRSQHSPTLRCILQLRICGLQWVFFNGIKRSN